jgi:hypothetical protein
MNVVANRQSARHDFAGDIRMKKLILLGCSLVALFALPGRAETVVALTSSNRLLFFDSATPGTVTKIIYIPLPEEMLAAIDFRPQTGDLYAVAPSGTIIVVNPTSGHVSSPNFPSKTP